MTAAGLVQRMHAHKRWANRRLLDAVEELPERDRHRSFGIGHGSAWASIVHLWRSTPCGSRRSTAARTRRSPAPMRWARPKPSNRRDVADQRWVDLLDILDDGELSRLIWRISSSTGGRRRGMPLHDVLIHVCTHAQCTGGQLVNILRRLRVEEPPRISLSTMSLRRLRRPLNPRIGGAVDRNEKPGLYRHGVRIGSEPSRSVARSLVRRACIRGRALREARRSRSPRCRGGAEHRGRPTFASVQELAPDRVAVRP